MGFVEKMISESLMKGIVDTPLHVLLPPFFHRDPTEDNSNMLLSFIFYIEGYVQIFIWYTLLGWALYAVSVTTMRKRGGAKFTYSVPIDPPGDKVTLMGGLKYVLPRAIYTHPSFKIDMLWTPFATVLRLAGVLTVTLGAGVVQAWLSRKIGTSFIAIPDGYLAVALQVVILLLARDFSRYMWHYQAHSVRFFWEFHKVHHSAEVLHPFGVRTHPVDLFLRNSYIGIGGAVLAGGLMFVLGMTYSPTAGYIFTGIISVLGLFEHFEHSHVSLSFGKYVGRYIYSPYLHQFHHGAGLEHRDVNLGIAGGLTLWDRLFGTYYLPKEGEKVIWGSSLEELGENNPHRTIWGLFWTPFVEAFRLRKSAVVAAPPAARQPEIG
jgi:sterol desaturase/sphingolipid hydroxylase (fatty acid hydroxylase superfamily)